MNVGIIGTGNMGTALGRRLAGAGHTLIFGSRNPRKASKKLNEAGLRAQVGTVEEAAYLADILVLAVPGMETKRALKGAGELAGKLLIDLTNPLNESFDLAMGFSTSGAEELALAFPKAQVVKAFNTIFAGVFNSGPDYDGRRAVVFYAGDDPASKETVRSLIADVGFDPVDAGPLKNARYLEPAYGLLIQVAYGQQMGTQLAFDLLRR